MNKILFLVLAGALALTAPAFAQGKPTPPSFSDIDVNGDDAISVDEFNTARAERIAKRAQQGRRMKHVADAPSFGDIDSDGDGSVSRDEFATHQAEHKAKRAQRHAGPGGKRNEQPDEES